ncbi:MAG: signal peptidase [Actinomycetota bacterium]|jgi:signal peptidase|nr:signal peptidase [Actinomycetota bacterium]MDQ1568518.1 signal peptidase [Actinomycetota bacterium]
MRPIGQWAGRILLAMAAAVLLAVGIGPLTGAYRMATVLSGSMGPGMPVGSVAVLVPIDPAAVHVGDVITYQAPTPERQVVTHRVVEITEPGPHPVLRTKGDANAAPDPWSARLDGAPAWRRVAVIPYAGTVIRTLRSAPVHHATVHLVPALLLSAMLVSIWLPATKKPGRRPRLRRRASRRQAVAVVAVVILAAGGPAALAAFTRTTTASNSVGAAADWVAPSVTTTVIAKQTGYLAGAVKQGGSYYVYANVADSGNPASGVATVKTDESAITSGQTNVALTAGSYSVNGVNYGYRSALQTASSPLSGGKTYSITSTDALGYSSLQTGYTVTVDNTPPAAADIQTTNHAGGTVGTAEIGDTIIYTFSKQIDPQSILAGWTGASTNVIVHLEDGGCTLILCSADDFVVYNGGSQLTTLGIVSLADAGYTGGSLLGSAPDTIFGATGTTSTMVQSGATITITLGTRSGSGADNGGTTTMSWNSDTAPYDAAGNAASGNTKSETGAGDKEF